MTAYFWTIDLAALITSCIALFYTVRLRSTYFLGSRLFIALANLGFIAILVQSTIDDFLQVGTNEQFYLSMVAVMLFSVGSASYLLQSQNNSIGIREILGFFRQPSRQFLFYSIVVFAWASFVLLIRPYSIQSISIPEGVLYYTQPDLAFSLANLLVLIAFLILPVLAFYRQSTVTRDSKASESIKTISYAWALLGLVAFLQSVVPIALPTLQSVLQMANGILFLMIAYALREPTVMGRMIGVLSGRSDGLYFGYGGVTIVLYNVDSDRRRFVEEFLRTETSPDGEAFCYVAKSDVPFYHAIARETLPQQLQQRRAKVTIRPIEDSGLTNTSSTELSRSRRELIDTAELDVSVCKKFAEDRRRIDQSGRSPRSRLWAISADTGRAILLDEISRMNPGARIVDLAANQNTFSQRLGIVHSALLGNRILLEYDPVSNFEGIVREFVNEFISNVQTVAVFTSLGSPVYREIQQTRNARRFIFSSKISTPSKSMDGQVLLPDRDSSLLLDAVDKLIVTHKGESVALVLEVVTDIVLSQGFEKTYGVLSSILELAESGSSTGLVLVNTTCIDEMALQGIRGLFRLNYRYGSEGLINVRSNSSTVSSPLNRGTTVFDDQASSLRSATVS